jgi:Fe-S cluster assembly iron-binding protein IscA
MLYFETHLYKLYRLSLYFVYYYFKKIKYGILGELNKGRRGRKSMQMIVTEKAETAMKQLVNEEPIVIRLRTEYNGGCSVYVIVDLICDDLLESDVVYNNNGIVILLSEYGKEYLGEKVTIDYGIGFTVRTPNETIVYGLSIAK